jgi:hypothetical protein
MIKRFNVTWILIAGLIFSLFSAIPVSAQTNEDAKKVVEKNDYSEPST